MNKWCDRLAFGLVLYLAMKVHGNANAPLPNTKEFALLFFGTAATLEYLILRMAPLNLEGQLCTDMQTLSLVCICVDAAGFAAYMTKTPSIFYNTIMWGLAYVQWGRLLFRDGGDVNSLWDYLVRRSHHRRA